MIQITRFEEASIGRAGRDAAGRRIVGPMHG